MRYSDIKVDKDNYRKYEYVGNYSHGELEELTDEELKAQIFYLKDIIKGLSKRTKNFLKKLTMQSLEHEFRRRKIYVNFRY